MLHHDSDLKFSCLDIEVFIHFIGEISELKMKQISQSQFISISDTLCEIVKGLNESQIAATFECVVSRLCSSFDSVVIPPMAAIKKSLDLLIGEQRLEFINGSYHLKNSVVVSKPRKKSSPTPHAVTTETQSHNRHVDRHVDRHVLLSKETATENQRQMKREKTNGYECLEYETVKREKAKIGKMDNTGNVETERQKERKMSKKDMSFETKDRSGKNEKNKVVKSSSLKVRKPNHCIPRRQFSYEELGSHAKYELRDKKQIKKRNTFLGRLSRLFRMEDEKLTGDDETDNDSNGDICDDGWEKIVTDEQVKLISNKVKTQQKHAPSQDKVQKNRKKKSKRIKVGNISNNKQIHRTRHVGNLSRNKNVQIRRPVYSKRCPSLSSRSSSDISSRLRTSDKVNTKFGHRNKRSGQKTECSPMRGRSVEQYSLSSYSGSSCSDLNRSDCSLSSESSVELARKSFHYSEEDTTDVESLQATREDGAQSEFCSTQAICGDLEVSTFSLNPSNELTSSSETASIKHVEKHSSTSGMNNSGVSDHQTNLRSRNLVQLIGVL